MAKKFKFRSNIFLKYFASFFAVIFVIFLILGSSLLIFVGQYWKSENFDVLSENAKTLAHTSEKYFINEDLQQNSTMMLAYSISLVSSAIDADMYICDLDGNVILCKDAINSQTSGKINNVCIKHASVKIPKNIIMSASRGNYSFLGEVEGVYDEYNLLVGEPIKVNNHVIAVIFAAEPAIENMYPYVASILKMFSISGLFAFFFAFVVVSLVTYSFTKPLREMSKTTKSYATGDFSKRLTVKGRDEMAELALSLNSMAQALSQFEYSRRSFVANVSHELKTPMTIISGFVDGILDGTIQTHEQEHYLKIVSSEVKRISRLVVSMLNMSKIEAGELSIKLDKADISEIVFNAMLLFETQINEKNIEITGFDKIESAFVNIDKDLIQQVVYNLIDNAVKFTPEGGEIGVEVLQDKLETCVTIKNSGQGISDEEIKHIFERFYKIDKSRSLDAKSTGLGLYIVKNIVELHGGMVAASSNLGKDTSFSFTLPNE